MMKADTAVINGLLVNSQSIYPGMIYGLTGQKGSIQVGCDADLLFVDLKCGWTPYHGRELQGDVVLTMVRGKVVMEEGKVIGEPGWGKFITRKDASIP